MTTKVRVLVALGQLEPCLSLFDLVLPGQQPKVLNVHADVVAAGLISGDVALCESCVEVTLFLIETDGRVLVLVGQLEPALSRLLTLLPGQHPKVLESHAAFVLATLALVIVNGRVLVVVGQLEPALSRLLTLLPGQQPKVLESHADFVLAKPSCVTTNERVLLVVAQLEPARSRLLTVLPAGQQPKLLE